MITDIFICSSVLISLLFLYTIWIRFHPLRIGTLSIEESSVTTELPTTITIKGLVTACPDMSVDVRDILSVTVSIHGKTQSLCADERKQHLSYYSNTFPGFVLELRS